MKYKAEYEKMLDKYAKLLNFAYGCIADLKKFTVTDSGDEAKAFEREKELQEIVKG